VEVTDEIVDHIAHLSRLEFSGEKKTEIKEDLQRIISFMDKLQEVDTGNVEPLIFMTEEVNRLREDKAQVTLTQDQVLQNAPKKDSDYFRIPKVLDKS
jgi:aspartyl-tRNA(Asn)/glutamyl-tRNA(Gln) amidotransferase subunit C